MHDSSKNHARVTAKIPLSVREILQRAAELSGTTLNQFLVQAALKEAHQVLEAERVITLSEQDADKVFTLIENPPEPNARLLAAAAKHKAFFSENH